MSCRAGRTRLGRSRRAKPSRPLGLRVYSQETTPYSPIIQSTNSARGAGRRPHRWLVPVRFLLGALHIGAAEA